MKDALLFRVPAVYSTRSSPRFWIDAFQLVEHAVPLPIRIDERRRRDLFEASRGIRVTSNASLGSREEANLTRDRRPTFREGLAERYMAHRSFVHT